MAASKPLPRFVPTLTEIVQPGGKADLVAPAKPIDRDALIEQVLAAVKPRLEQQLRKSLTRMVDEQIHIATLQWHGDIAATVSSMVEHAMEQQKPLKK